jgi:hypothetical protein
VLRHAAVTTTVVGITVHPHRTPPVCSLYLQHYPVNARQQQLSCMQPSAGETSGRPPIGYNVREAEASYRLDALPHYRVPDCDRSEAQKQEAGACLADFAQQVQRDLLRQFGELNEREWHRTGSAFGVLDEVCAQK